MQLSKKLILFQFILKQFGYDDFVSLRAEFNIRETGSNASGRSYFAGILVNRSKIIIEKHTLFAYDEAIQGYEKKLREHRAEPLFTLKYYQWLALLFTEYYLDRYATNKIAFIRDLNAFIQHHSDFKGMDGYTENDLKKLAFWMATGSGKTLLMHCNYWQILKYLKDWENIILITPNEGLSRQHYEEFIQSGIGAAIYSGSEESLKTLDGEVLIIEITKLTTNKSGEGVSVDVDYFSESKNLVFIDEGHKGQRSEEKAWKKLREHITRGEGSFTFEYSATFGQIIGSGDSDLLREYGRSIIFDYSYRHFYTDGYGKDFAVFNIDAQNDYSEIQNRLLLTAGLLGFYEQLALFEEYREELRIYNIEKPLWIFVGSKVIGSGSKTLSLADRQNISDVSHIVKFFTFVLSQPAEFQKDIDKILSGRSGLNAASGEDIFKNRFQSLHIQKPSAEQIIQTVFNGTGGIEAFQIKQADGEIALKTRTSHSDHYFAVINIGDVPKYAKKLEEDTGGELVVQDNLFTTSLFHGISSPASKINILIGSKKFIEGWNSWRVSSMGLMNMGKSEGPQIIQLFGRGVRLKGKGHSLKREDADAPYHVKALQTISIFGLNASYMNRFLSEIEKEVCEYTNFTVDIRFNRKEQWSGNIVTFERQGDFKEHSVALACLPQVCRRVSLDLRNKVSVAAGGFNSQVAEDAGAFNVNFLLNFIDFIDFNALTLEACRYRLLKGYTNLIVMKSAIEAMVRGDDYSLLAHPGQFGLAEAISGKIQNIAAILIKDYINKFYADKEKAFLTRHLTYKMLNPNMHGTLFPEANRIIVKAPRQHLSVIEELKAGIEELYKNDSEILPTIHFGNHLYSPIASWEKGERFNEVKTVPTRLNQGERDFLVHLRGFLIEAADRFKDKNVFVLRNLSQKGICFFIESSSFFPDFILWVVAGNVQHIYFLDPKGIRETRNFNNPKVIFCREQTADIERKINEDLKNDDLDLSVTVSAYILSVTPFKEISLVWGEGNVTLEKFTENHVLFINESKAYLSHIFKNSDHPLPASTLG